MLEELDAPNEYHYEASTRTLRLLYNGSAATHAAAAAAAAQPPPPSQVEVAALTNLIELRGSADRPVANVTLRGLTFRDTRPSYLDPHGVPSGGDWALSRLGAVYVEGATDAAIADVLAVLARRRRPSISKMIAGRAKVCNQRPKAGRGWSGGGKNSQYNPEWPRRAPAIAGWCV